MDGRDLEPLKPEKLPDHIRQTDVVIDEQNARHGTGSDRSVRGAIHANESEGRRAAGPFRPALTASQAANANLLRDLRQDDTPNPNAPLLTQNWKILELIYPNPLEPAP